MSARLKPANAQLPGLHLSWGLWRTFSDTGSVSLHWYFCLSLRRDTSGKGSVWLMHALFALRIREERVKKTALAWGTEQWQGWEGISKLAYSPFRKALFSKKRLISPVMHKASSVWKESSPHPRSLPALATGCVPPWRYLPSTALRSKTGTEGYNHHIEGTEKTS